MYFKILGKEYECPNGETNYEITVDLIIKCPEPVDFCSRSNL